MHRPFMILLALMVIGIAGVSHAYVWYEKDGERIRKIVYARGTVEVYSCSKYLGAYAEAAIKPRSGGFQYTSKVGSRFGQHIGYVTGYMDATNDYSEGKSDWYKPMELSKVLVWVASWCRDNSNKYLFAAMTALNFVVHKQK